MPFSKDDLFQDDFYGIFIGEVPSSTFLNLLTPWNTPLNLSCYVHYEHIMYSEHMHEWLGND